MGKAKPVEFVWVVEHSMSMLPRVEKYKLLERMPGGGVRVQIYERDKVIRKASGRQFYFEAEKLWKMLTKLATDEMLAAERKHAELKAVLSEPDGLERYLRVELERMRDVPHGPPPRYKKE